MASSSKSLHHGRSLSLPSRSTDLSISQFNENLTTSRASAATSSSLCSMNDKLSSLQKMYNNIDDFLMLPHIQQLISKNSKEKSLDQVLDDHIHLLDALSSTKDLISQTKQDVQVLISALRRKDTHAIHSYSVSRRMSKKMFERSLKSLKTSKTSVDSESIPVVHMLKEAELITCSILDSLLTYMMGTKSQSAISKLLGSKKVSPQTNEFDNILKMSQENEKLMRHLKSMESSIQLLEEEVECLFRQLIRTRVSLLNILNH